MPANGYLTVHTFTSEAQLPVEGVTVSVTQRTPNGPRLLATRITDENGLIAPLPIMAPDAEESREAGNLSPFTAIDIMIDHPSYERILVENAQVFAGINSRQEMQLVPFEERPDTWNLTEVFQVTPQSL